MPVITLPDGTQRSFCHPVSVMDVALNISLNLAESCIAGCVNGELVDSDDLIIEDSRIEIITTQNDSSLEIIRCSCIHVLGRAIKQLWPNAKMATGEIIDNGFYYDIELDQVLNKKDLKILEKHMHYLIAKNYSFVKKKVHWHEAYNLFIERDEIYKINYLDQNDITHNNYYNLYYQDEYIDICHGPHVSNVKFCRYFKLQALSGAYWCNKKENKMLQRISGTAWSFRKQLDDYLNLLEQSSKRDHRKIGKQLNLYHMQEEAPGLVFWHNDGWIVFRELESFLRLKLKEYNYYEVKSPSMMDRILWEKTGHWENYKEGMFTTFSENREYCIKPMNCPGHIQIFNQRLKSYRELPLRMAEFGSCHRNEPSGALHGLMRVRAFTQDDAHIFCREDQIRAEVNNCIRMAYDVYNNFGFKKILVKISTRPTKRIGTDEIWEKAELDLVTALQENAIPFEYQSGEGAFYGPKIEFILFDCLQRSWQCGTIQLDFSLPRLLHATYIDENNNKQIPVIIHRAILGSIERFIGILIEQFAGFFPTWLAPTQVIITNISLNEENYVNELKKKFQNFGFRVKADLRNEKIGFKIREHVMHKIPYILICGAKEVETGKVTVRTCRGKNFKNIDVDTFIEKLQHEIYSRYYISLEEE